MQANFLRAVEQAFELDPGTITGEEELASAEWWDSLRALSLIALVDKQYGVILTGKDLESARTLNDLLKKVGSTSKG